MGDVLRDLQVAWQPVLPHPRHTLVDFYFRWAGIDGLTNPFGLEVVLNSRLLDVERPAVLAHEWAHVAGGAIGLASPDRLQAAVGFPCPSEGHQLAVCKRAAFPTEEDLYEERQEAAQAARAHLRVRARGHRLR
jgi:hypothetical protein